MDFKEGDFPRAERYYLNAISLPIHVLLKKEEQKKIVDTLSSILKKG